MNARSNESQASDSVINDATELAAAQELRKYHLMKFRYDVDRGIFFHFQGIWREDKTGEVFRRAKVIAKRSAERMQQNGVDRKTAERTAQRLQSAAGIDGIVKLFRSEEGIAIESSRFDANDLLLTTENCTINLHTGEARSHRADDLITKQIPVVYDSAADCPTWRAFLNRIMAGNNQLIAYLQRLAGLFLTGSANVHELFIAYGSGANGKSVFFDTLLGLMGDYAGVAPESLLMARSGHAEHPTEIADLKGKRVVVASETDSRGELRLQMVKRLTGDTILKARFMRQDFFEFRRTHKLVLVTNNKPRIPESTEAVWRRIRLIPFNVTIPPEDRDPNLLIKLRAEWPGILYWALQGCLAQQRSGMMPPAEVLAATEQYRSEGDPVEEYIADRLIAGELARVSRDDLYCDYCAWADRKHLSERDRLDRASLFDEIRRLEGVSESQWKIDGRTSPVRGFKGIGICGGAKQ